MNNFPSPGRIKLEGNSLNNHLLLRTHSWGRIFCIHEWQELKHQDLWTPDFFACKDPSFSGPQILTLLTLKLDIALFFSEWRTIPAAYLKETHYSQNITKGHNSIAGTWEKHGKAWASLQREGRRTSWGQASLAFCLQLQGEQYDSPVGFQWLWVGIRRGNCMQLVLFAMKLMPSFSLSDFFAIK